MFDRVLVPLDGSMRSEAILGHVERLFGNASPELVLLRVMENYLTPEHEEHNPGWYDWSEDLIRKNLWALEGRLRARGVDARSLLLKGRPAEVILDAAAEQKASLIAMSTHGYGGAMRWAFGSVADKVLAQSPLPLIMARVDALAAEGGAAVAGSTPVRRILVPLDAGVTVTAVTAPVVALARLHGAEVTLFHVQAPSHWLAPLGEDATEADAGDFMFRAREFLESQQVKVRCATRAGTVADAVLAELRENRHDLVALGTHGRRGISRVLYGNLADQVMRHTNGLPCLVVPCAEETGGD